MLCHLLPFFRVADVVYRSLFEVITWCSFSMRLTCAFVRVFNAWSSIAPWYNCCSKLQRITSEGCLTTYHIDITSNIYIQGHPVRNTINYIVLTQHIWQSLPRVTRPFSVNSQRQATQTIRHAVSRATHRAAAWTTSSDKQLIHLYNWEHVRTFIWLWFFTQSLEKQCLAMTVNWSWCFTSADFLKPQTLMADSPWSLWPTSTQWWYQAFVSLCVCIGCDKQCTMCM